MAKKANEKVMKMRDDFLKKRAALLVYTKPVYIAGEFFRPSVINQRGEFQVATAKAGQLLEGVKSLYVHEVSAKVLNMSTDHLGFSAEAWIEDFKTRKAVLDRSENLSKLAAFEVKLKQVMTPSQLREIGIGDLESEIEKL